ncbi:hypothetical protein, conserved [Trypanosoma brucei brucei TREU927]|uniref:Uncharacterized protein n=1 Tax=Trypanosoma brucei brucei (strain 927/4 GUTat10.1) TaxID=185431 RepID=Q38A10_TRYB2|nr:hypothetical protein, conserved [Trypanosoma brucei brucei TREU927]EAN78360.1 hypothetical protein, conserved [Trypanosoma brucei brucei TREU927]
MLSTLFFDGADATSALHVRTTLEDRLGDAPARTAADNVVSYQAMDFPSSGSIPVPSLRATLLWWLDRDEPLVHILLTGSTVGDMSYSSRKLSVELVSPRHTIIACGVTHVRDQAVFAVSWVTSLLEAGALQIQLQRSSDHHSQLLIVPDEQAVLTSRFSGVAAAFEYDASVVQAKSNGNGGNVDDEEGNGSEPTLCASVIASLPQAAAADGLLSVILLSNGCRLWRVEIASDGTFVEHEFKDASGTSDSDGEFLGGSLLPSWLLTWSQDHREKSHRRYIAVSSVQLTHYFAILRSNGSIGLYDDSLSTISSASECALTKDEMVFSHALQWSALIGNDVHVVTSFGRKEIRQCLWARIPIASTSGDDPKTVKMTILPPSSTSTLLGCVAINPTRLSLLWGIGAEEDACIRCSLSVGSLMHANEQGLSGILQIIDAEEELDADGGSISGSCAYSSLREAQTFFCHSKPLHALTAVGEEMVLVEKVDESVRAHVLTSDMSPLEEMLESAFAVTRPVAATTHCTLPLASLHLIPTVVRESGCATAGKLEAFYEGIELAASCAEAADHLSALLINAVHCVPVASTLGGFQLLRSAAHLQGYTPSGFVNEDAIKAAIEHATMFFDVSTRKASFCSYSRHFIQHTIARDLLLRVAYLTCSFIGWMGSDPDYRTSPEIARVRATLELLSAAYHSVSVTGPSTATIVPEVRKTVVDDAIRLFLQFTVGEEAEGNDVLFAVRVANRLRACNEARGPKACATWCNLLSRRYPCLQHFRIIRCIEVGRTSCPSQLAAMCLATTFHLVNCPVPVAKALLLDCGLAIYNDSTFQTAFNGIDVREWWALLDDSGDSNDGKISAVIASVYRVALLRCIVHPGTSHHASASASLVRELFLAELIQLGQHLQESRLDCPGILRALTELRVDTHMFLARAALDDPNFGDAFRSIADVQQIAVGPDIKTVCMEKIGLLIGEVVEIASSSDELTDCLVDVTHCSAELDTLLTSKWYSFIARLAVRSGSTEAEQLRWRAAIGLYRYLCKRHAYGQAGRMMTDLTTAIRCSSLRANVVETVVELTSLAVTAVELISPIAPLQVQDSEPLDGAQESSTFSACSGTGCFFTPEYAAVREPLGREHLPWVRRRHYQAYCEQQLLKANRRVDCTDLWVENPPPAAYAAALRRFVEALMEARLWTEALRFAAMAGADVGLVLQNHALDLMKHTNYTCDEEALEEWVMLVASCEEFSTLSNKYSPLRSTVVTALLCDCEKVCPALLDSLLKADRYEALQALLEVFETLLRRNSFSEGDDMTDGEDRNHDSLTSAACNEEEGDDKSDGAYKPWMLLLKALQIGTAVLMDSLSNEEKFELNEAPMTAGVFDPMVRRASELLNSPLLLQHPSLVKAEGTATNFLKFVGLVKQKKLAGL